MIMHATARNAAKTVADLTLSRLRKSYGSTNVVDGIDLDVEAGELVSLLGPSGCGKTTTLRMIAGLAMPSHGDILFKGRSVTDVPVHKREVGVLFQSYALFPHMTVQANVAFGLEMRSNDRKRHKALVSDALEMVQLSHLTDRYPHQLSGGQQQRVALARALVIEPAVLLLDEPFGALDKKLREDMQIQMKDIQKRLKITTIMVTHDQEEALTISDKIAVMNAGRIEQYGPPSEIYDRPATRFVAGFIGSSNVFEAEIIRRDGQNGLLRTSAGITMTVRHVGPAQSHFLCLRPEMVSLSIEGGADHLTEPDRATGIIERVVFRGPSTDVRVAVSPGQIITASIQNDGHVSQLRPGSRVSVQWPEGAAYSLRS
ncbi:ABC transporter ATP-binding protein [Rhizobium sp. S152]|uniref:ABC transporter ATP-binding protein n=1 Tax=Rhizobium sp. S152 TaxID=3055038 RepID=UPI0025A947BE|nr:ABC transporter ATP-binding protein [Rhizobium sp. S152]MDM9624676.1 ABC transporter ATP-binding protein [Rhizobium sp. S152]